MENHTYIIRRIEESIDVKKSMLSNPELVSGVEQMVDVISSAYLAGKKTLFCGNGGSAADAQHLAAELSGKFYLDRLPIHAEACHVNTSFITAVSNDYGFEETYARYIQAIGKPGDILVAISTSGNSQNILNAVSQAKGMGMICVGMTGTLGGKLEELVDVIVKVPSINTPRIQEAHILVGHIVCEMVESKLFGQ